MMKNFTVCFTLLFVCVAVFPEESPTLSRLDIIGTFRLEKIEQDWRGDAEWIEESLKWFDDMTLFEIREDRYILGPFEHESQFQVEGTIVGDGAIYIPGAKYYYRSDFSGHFPEYPRMFKSVIVPWGYIPAIEVLDYDTLVIYLNNAWLLYKRVE
jgi:hypothetical protein